MNNYTATITSKVTAEDAYQTITEGMAKWWTPMSANFLKIGDKAKTDFGGKSYEIFEAKTLDNPTLVELACCESYIVINGLEDTEEWTGTILRFEITEKDDQTEIKFTHIGLTPALGCFDV